MDWSRIPKLLVGHEGFAGGTKSWILKLIISHSCIKSILGDQLLFFGRRSVQCIMNLQLLQHKLDNRSIIISLQSIEATISKNAKFLKRKKLSWNEDETERIYYPTRMKQGSSKTAWFPNLWPSGLIYSNECLAGDHHASCQLCQSKYCQFEVICQTVQEYGFRSWKSAV